MNTKNNLYNIPFGCNFLEEAVKDILSKYPTGESLANMLIIAPNQRMIPSIQNTFVKLSNTKAMLLPKIIAISDVEYFFSNININELTPEELEILSKSLISSNTRQYMLSKLIHPKHPNLTLTQKLELAEDLGKIIDQCYKENVDINDISKLDIIESLSNHWKDNMDFLPLIYNSWQDILKSSNAIDAQERQKFIYQIQSKQLKNNKYPIIAFHITSVYPYVLELVKSIKDHSNATLYFYGIDKTLDIKQDIAQYHPQYETHNTLVKLNINPQTIVDIKNDNPENQTIIHRLFDEKIYTNSSINHIHKFIDNISLVNSKTEHEEALSIALLIKKYLNTRDISQNIAVICKNPDTLDRLLTELKRWNINADNYIGTSLYNFQISNIFILIIETIYDNFEPLSFLSLIKHPLFKLNIDETELKTCVDFLDEHILRDYIVKTSPSNLENIIETYYIKKEKREKDLYIFTNVSDQTLLQVENFLKTLQKLFGPIFYYQNNADNISKIIENHINIAQYITKTTDTYESILWANEEGKQLSLFCNSLMNHQDLLNSCKLEDYYYLILYLIKKINIMNTQNTNNRVAIYSALQSNLMQQDIMIVANLNESFIPTESSSSPWINNYIRNQIGLTTNKYDIGTQAHYFSQMLGSKELVLCNSNKVNNKIVTPSRFLLQLQTFLSYYKIAPELLNKHQDVINLRNTMQSPNISQIQTIKKASVVVNPSRLPKKLSASALETLNKNPYEFFIRYVLHIRALSPISTDVSATIYGTAVHTILESFWDNIFTYRTLPFSEQFLKLETLAQEEFKSFNLNVVFYNLVFQKTFLSLKDWLKEEQSNIKHLQSTILEQEGKYSFEINPTTNISITSKTDRIDVLNDQTILITDYKTGSQSKVKSYMMQLNINQYLIQQKGFCNLEITGLEKYNIQSRYLFLSKQKSNIEIKTAKQTYDTIQEYDKVLLELLHPYYNETYPMEFTSTKDIDEQYVHFSRYNEWTTDIQINDNNDKEEDNE